MWISIKVFEQLLLVEIFSFNSILFILENIPSLPDIPAVKEKLAKSSSQQKKTGKEESGILNIENEAPKSLNKVRRTYYWLKLH